LKHHVVVELAFNQAFWAEQRRQRLQNVRASDVNAPLGELEGCVGGEEAGDLAPLPLVEVVAVRGLQSLQSFVRM
jgi:hypothetical protein